MMKTPNFIRRFLRDEDASITIEAVMILPLLLWGYFGMFVLYDGYRAASSNIRASYTISDMLSREDQTVVTQAYVDGLNDIQDVLTQSPHRTVLRVTAVEFFNGQFSINNNCSFSTAGKTAVTDATLTTEILPYLPTMGSGDVLLVVETWMAFVPFMNITLETLYNPNASPDKVVFGPFYFENIVTTRPRHGGPIACA